MALPKFAFATAVAATALIAMLPLHGSAQPTGGQFGSWSEREAMGKARYGASAVSLEEDIYVLGGWDDGGQDSTSMRPAEQYDLDANTLSVKGGQTPRDNYGPGAVQSGEKGSVEVLSSGIPDLLDRSAIWDGTNAYLFGGFLGRDEHSNEIYKFHPPSRTGATESKTFPYSGLEKTAAVWSGDHAYIMGGRLPGNTIVDEVYRFTPSTGELREVSALPSAREHVCAAWANDAFFAFGGWTGSSRLSQISKYVPSDARTYTLSTSLPKAANSVMCASTGSTIYLFGGMTGSREYSTSIYSFSPSSERVTKLSTSLPFRYSEGVAVWSGDRIFLVGGWEFLGEDGGASFHGVMVFDPGTRRLEIVDDVFNGYWTYGGANIDGGGAVWANGRLLLFDHNQVIAWTPPSFVFQSSPSSQASANDADGDGVPDASDACPGAPDYRDRDGDGLPDACDSTPDGAGSTDIPVPQVAAVGLGLLALAGVRRLW